MSKYVVKTEVEAVLLLDKDADSVRGVAEMLPGVPHMFTKTGIVFPGADGSEGEMVAYGMYLVKEKHGLSAMTKELFESVAERVDPINYDSRRGDDLTIGRLRNYLNQLPEGVMTREVWVSTGDNVSSQCVLATPLNKRSENDFDILLGAVE